MRLTEAVATYVEARQLNGSPFRSSKLTLLSFCKHCGDIELCQVTANLVWSFTNSAACEPVTRVSKFSGVKCFLDYCHVRGQIPALPLRKPAKPHNTRSPFIYTRAQIASLLRNADRCQSKASELDAKTLRLLILLSYATGVTVQEAVRLRWSSVDLKKRTMAIEKSFLRAARTLPIGTDLARHLAQFRPWKRTSGECDFVLCGRDGNTVDVANLKVRFGRLRVLAGLAEKVDGRVARLQDLRFTFAVHRLNHWIRRGDDLNRLVPALSTYMGYRNLTTAEQFLAYVPNRFKRDLQKLSPAKGRKAWAKDKELIAFLTSL
jgi:integrase